jgi:hypothetical protein
MAAPKVPPGWRRLLWKIANSLSWKSKAYERAAIEAVDRLKEQREWPPEQSATNTPRTTRL